MEDNSCPYGPPIHDKVKDIWKTYKEKVEKTLESSVILGRL